MGGKAVPLVLGLIGLLSGALGLIGIASGQKVLSEFGVGNVPIAPSSSISAMLLSASIIGIMTTRNRAILGASLVASVFVLTLAGWVMITFPFHMSFDIEHTLFPYHESLNGVDLGHMSPIAAAGYGALSIAILIALARKSPGKNARQASAILTTSVFLVGTVGILGYAYGAPLLYGSSLRPVALAAAIAMFAAGLSATMLTWKDCWPMRAFLGDSVQARLLRAFLPAMSATVLVVGWTYTTFVESSTNPAIVASLLALVSSVVVAVIVTRIAGSIGGQVDRSNKELRRMQESLKTVNKELESFSYSVSHDLRNPLRAIDGFANLLQEEYGARLDEKGNEQLSRVRGAAQKMEGIIDDLLQLSRATKADMRPQPVDLATIANGIVARLMSESPDRHVRFMCVPMAWVNGDAKLLEIALENVLNNAWKFTSRREDARIDFGVKVQDNIQVYFIRDNGAGFDSSKADKLFEPFVRLHSGSEFPGSGIGLATVQRIINRHGGEVWADGARDKGATIYFTIGDKRPVNHDASENVSAR